MDYDYLSLVKLLRCFGIAGMPFSSEKKLSVLRVKTEEKHCTTLLVYGNLSDRVNKTAFFKSKFKVTLCLQNR